MIIRIKCLILFASFQPVLIESENSAVLVGVLDQHFRGIGALYLFQEVFRSFILVGFDLAPTVVATCSNVITLFFDPLSAHLQGKP